MNSLTEPDTRYSLQNLLANYSALDDQDSNTLIQFCDFVSRYPTCFERSLDIGHITGSAWLVNRAADSVLLTHHVKLGSWLQLGGHADGDSNILRVALKEAVEESGIVNMRALSENIFDLDIHPIPARGTTSAHLHYDVRFAFQTVDTDEFVVSPESHALRWVKIANLEEVTRSWSILRMRQKWLNQNL